MSDATPVEEPDVLEQLKNVKADGAEPRNFTITFLSLLLYVNLIIAGTDAEQILRVAPVNLPLLNMPLPIIGFYGFLPWLILLFICICWCSIICSRSSCSALQTN